MFKSLHLFHRPTKIVLLSILALLSISACSNQSLYDGFQENLKQECLRQPPAQQEQCLQEIRDDYEEYRREREEVLAEDE